jgi:CubicO group peptidase (beta-lactamase class C family)
VRRVIAIASLCSVLALVHAGAQTPVTDKQKPPDDATFAKHVEAMVKAWGDLGWFSGAVLVARGDRTVARTAAGMASAELEVPNTPDTRFRIGSLSQVFTSAAILKLQEQGKLSVDDPLGRHMTEWPQAHKTLTIEQLLINRSGMTDVSQLSEFTRTIAVPRKLEELVAMILSEPIKGKPGEPGGSSNSNFHLLAALVEQVSGAKFHDFLQREFFEPLGLKNTGYDDPFRVIDGRAEGLSRSNNRLTKASWFHMANAIGSADLSSTVDDVHKFVRALATSRVLRAASIERMTKVPAPASQSATPGAPSTGYGLRVVQGPPVAWTTQGFINGGVSNLQYIPETETTILVLSNVTGSVEVSVIARHIARVAAGAAPYLPSRRTGSTPRPEDVALAVGTWEIPGAFFIGPSGVRQPLQLIVKQEGDRVLVSQTGSREEAWLSDAPGHLFHPYSDQQIIVDAATPGQVTYVSWGGRSTVKRVP